MAQGESPRNPLAFASVLLPRKVPGLSAKPLGFGEGESASDLGEILESASAPGGAEKSGSLRALEQH